VRLAIIGSGISGLIAASELARGHAVVLFEAEQRLGGHTNTVDVPTDQGSLAIDTGFIVFNDWTYPNFIGWLQHLGVASQPTSMGFSLHCSRCGLEYAGSSLDTLFAQRSNLWRPSFYRLLTDIVRFNRWSQRAADELPSRMTVHEFLAREGYSASFAEHYLLPMGAAIWSCPMATFGEFPIRFILEFYRNHGLLSVARRPKWRTIFGGSRTYIDRMLARFTGEIRLGCPVQRVERSSTAAVVRHAQGTESFDEVIFACHSDQALALLAEPTRAEREILSQFPYGDNLAVLHTDESVLPQRRKVWSSWNYHVPQGTESQPVVTYNMNILQRLNAPRTYCVTLNAESSIAPDAVLARCRYSHPIFTVERSTAQQRHGELIRRHRTSYCGAYWGNGFHEDGVKSALAVCEAYGVRPAWAARTASADQPSSCAESAPAVNEPPDLVRESTHV
jgi:predicted NAD/FAD-binding protein